MISLQILKHNRPTHFKLVRYSLCLFGLGNIAVAFPSYGSLAGLSKGEMDVILPTLEYSPPGPPPGPLNDTLTKLVNDKAHPWKPLLPGDIRGPCPGLNTLASHGVCPFSLAPRFLFEPTSTFCVVCQWIPRDGIATPAQMISAAQEGKYTLSYVC